MNYPLNGSYMNNYNQGMNMNMNQPNAQSGSFRNVFGVLGNYSNLFSRRTSRNIAYIYIIFRFNVLRTSYQKSYSRFIIKLNKKST